MKIIFYLIVGTLIGWLLWGLATDDFSTDGFSLLLTGLIIGFLTGRRSQREEIE